MRILATLQLVIGVAVLGLGAVSWRSGGKNLMFAGGINVALATNLLGDSASVFRYAALAVLALLLIVTFATARRATWRSSRIELLLAGVIVAGIAASQLVANIPSAAQVALLVAIATSGILLLALTVLRMLGWVRRDFVS